MSRLVACAIAALVLWAQPASAVVYTIDLGDASASLTGTMELDATGTLDSSAFEDALVDYDITLSINGRTDTFLPSNSEFDVDTAVVTESTVSITQEREGFVIEGGTNFSAVYFFPLQGRFEVTIGFSSAIGSIDFDNGGVFAAAPVPLPAGAALLLSALGVFYVARQRGRA
ncbi:MAG: hypothetical protein AAF675_10665 [Pseudomonadota bacterium]